MADKPETKQVTETPQVPVTSERRKDPKRVETGKRLAAISRMAKEKKKKDKEESGPIVSNTTLAIAGLIVAIVTLVITHRMNKREEKLHKPKPEPQHVTVERQPDSSTLDTIE
jgi:hypothetical protein